MNRIASNKDMFILKLKGQISGMMLQLQNKLPINPKGKVNLTRFKDILFK